MQKCAHYSQNQYTYLLSSELFLKVRHLLRRFNVYVREVIDVCALNVVYGYVYVLCLY